MPDDTPTRYVVRKPAPGRRSMPKATDPTERSEAGRPGAFRHLPDVISLEDTVTSIRGDVPASFSGEDNAFIAAAVNAGG
jgi:hypothetical protein